MKKPHTRQIALYIIVILIAATILYSTYSAILWLRGDATAEPFYTLAATLVSLLLAALTWLRQRATPTIPQSEPTFDISTVRNQQIRATLLDNVQAEIVSGYLQNTFQEMFKWLDLGKRYQPQALQRHASYRRPDLPNQPIPPNKPISQLFRNSGRALLILGAPGSGKTFTLAELAHDLLGEAQTDPTAPIPVILNLASWATHQLPLLDWLIDSLNTEQQLARQTARTWVSHGALTLLLDGLDEVADDLRGICQKK